MICAFCGSDNRVENKFCGMCGVRLDQRKSERRLANAGGLKCPGCGHVNDSSYKFCGMCGTRVERRKGERRSVSVQQPRAVATANAQLPPPDFGATGLPQRPPASRQREETAQETRPREEPAAFFRTEHSDRTIHGPSFLGLNDAPEAEGTYLLEEEEPSRRGLRTLVLLAVLAAIVGLIFVQWRSGFKASPKPPQAPQAEPAPQKPQGANQGLSSPPLASPSSNGDSAAQRAGRELNGKTPSEPSGAKAARSPTDAGNAPPAEDEPATFTAAKPSTGGNSDLAAKPSTPGNPDSAANAPEAPAHSVSPRQKPSPAAPEPSVRKPNSMLVKAQQYLQGSGGVRQNCEQGLVYLRAAAQKNDPEAAVQMGALYASGHCVQRDPVMAWRWFNSAREQEPTNQFIKANMDRLWSAMTEKERRQAAR
ncbi:MAG TPA: zinc ribbon domain-containing protein [Candidatus Angelobacter sp.]